MPKGQRITRSEKFNRQIAGHIAGQGTRCQPHPRESIDIAAQRRLATRTAIHEVERQTRQPALRGLPKLIDRVQAPFHFPSPSSGLNVRRAHRPRQDFCAGLEPKIPTFPHLCAMRTDYGDAARNDPYNRVERVAFEVCLGILGNRDGEKQTAINRLMRGECR